MKSTVNIGMFHGGHNTNVVPSACTVEIDRRLLPDEKVKDAFAELKKVVDGAGEPRRQLHGRVPDRHQRLLRARRTAQAVAAFEAAVKQRTGRKVKFLNATGVERRPLFRRRRHRDHQFRPGLGRAGPCRQRERADRRDGRGGGDPARRGAAAAVASTSPLESTRGVDRLDADGIWVLGPEFHVVSDTPTPPEKTPSLARSDEHHHARHRASRRAEHLLRAMASAILLRNRPPDPGSIAHKGAAPRGLIPRLLSSFRLFRRCPSAAGRPRLDHTRERADGRKLEGDDKGRSAHPCGGGVPGGGPPAGRRLTAVRSPAARRTAGS